MKPHIVQGPPYYDPCACKGSRLVRPTFLIAYDHSAGLPGRYTVYQIPTSSGGRMKIVGRELPLKFSLSLAKKLAAKPYKKVLTCFGDDGLIQEYLHVHGKKVVVVPVVGGKSNRQTRSRERGASNEAWRTVNPRR